MPLEGKETSKIVEDVIAVRERWHNKKHPFFAQLTQGKLPLRAMGVYMAQHYHFVKIAARPADLLLDGRRAEPRPGLRTSRGHGGDVCGFRLHCEGGSSGS